MANRVEVLSVCAEILSAHRQQRVIRAADYLELVICAHAIILISQIVQEYLLELFRAALEITQDGYLFVEKLQVGALSYRCFDDSILRSN